MVHSVKERNAWDDSSEGLHVHTSEHNTGARENEGIPGGGDSRRRTCSIEMGIGRGTDDTQDGLVSLMNNDIQV